MYKYILAALLLVSMTGAAIAGPKININLGNRGPRYYHPHPYYPPAYYYPPHYYGPPPGYYAPPGYYYPPGYYRDRDRGSINFNIRRK